MAWARFIRTLLASLTLVVAPWLTGWHAAPHAYASLAHAEQPASCCGSDGSCCCAADLPSCPCCPAPAVPKPTSPASSPVALAAAASTHSNTRARAQGPTNRNLRQALVALRSANNAALVAQRSWMTPTPDVRLWTCVHQT